MVVVVVVMGLEEVEGGATKEVREMEEWRGKKMERAGGTAG